MPVSADRKYTKSFVHTLLESVKGKTLGEVDKSRQFARTETNDKITGIAGDVIEQSVFGYARDSKQECDIEIDGVLTELKTTGVRVPKADLAKAEVHPESNDERPRLVFELEYLESLPNNQWVRLDKDTSFAFKDTLLGRIFRD